MKKGLVLLTVCALALVGAASPSSCTADSAADFTAGGAVEQTPGAFSPMQWLNNLIAGQTASAIDDDAPPQAAGSATQVQPQSVSQVSPGQAFGITGGGR